jgi:hypothetical protein
MFGLRWMPIRNLAMGLTSDVERSLNLELSMDKSISAGIKKVMEDEGAASHRETR